ncbi:MAG: hypothetical protein O7C75_21420 [Verrucomicrobia bacterium]|nr:hypothetical protein [Verrucomicrobiota bacterium]
MTRLHINMSERENDYLAAASRIHDVTTVDISDNPDAVVTDDNQFHFEGKPVLLVNASPFREETWLFPALPWRFAPDVQAIADSLRAGNLGEPGLMRLHDWACSQNSQEDGSKIGAVDLARWLFDKDPDSIYGVSNHTGSKTCSLIHLGFPGGGMAMLDFTNALLDGEGYRSICLIGSLGAAYADDHANCNLLFAGGAPEASPPDSEQAFIQPMLEDFIASVREGSDSRHAMQNYRRALEIVTTSMANNTDS